MITESGRIKCFRLARALPFLSIFFYYSFMKYIQLVFLNYI